MPLRQDRARVVQMITGLNAIKVPTKIIPTKIILIEVALLDLLRHLPLALPGLLGVLKF